MTYTAPMPLIATLAEHSPLAKVNWKRRGLAPKGYVKGMAVSFGRAYVRLKSGHPAEVDMARPDSGDPYTDALTHCRNDFDAFGMNNSHGGEPVLRHLFVLMYGLGMLESSGQYCDGQDSTGGNTTSSTVEAGLFQVSYNSHGSSLLLDRLFSEYRDSNELLDIFKEGVTATASNLKNWGNGIGAEFQRLTKACPEFAVRYAAVVLRHDRRYSGPINRKEVELRWECDDLFRAVRTLIDRGGFIAV